jgi:hypothetical protein
MDREMDKMNMEELQNAIDALAEDFNWETQAGDPKGLAAEMDRELCRLEEKLAELQNQ